MGNNEACVCFSMLLGSGTSLSLQPTDEVTIEFIKPLIVMRVALDYQMGKSLKLTLIGPANDVLYEDTVSGCGIFT